jgi:hypothetical protein
LKKEKHQDESSDSRVSDPIEQRRQLHSVSFIVSARRDFARIK